MKRFVTIIFVVCAIFVFATWQYRLLCLLLVVLINRKWLKQKWPKWYPFLTWGLALAIFIAIPNYFQRGRSQMIYLNDKGERISTPWTIYAINALLPEEELMNAGMKLTAILPPASLSPVFKNLGSRLIRDAQKDFWNGMALTFYAPYNRLSLQGSNPGSFAIAQTMNETFGTNYDGIYVTKPKNYDSAKTYPIVFFAHGYLGNWEMYQGLLSRLEDCLVVSIGTKDLSGIFGHHDIQKIFNRYLPFLETEGFHIDKKGLHLIGLSNGGSASNVALRSFSNQFRTITYISTSCDVIKKSKAKVIMIGGGKDVSSVGLPNASRRLQKCGTNVALMYDKDDNHYMMVHQTDCIFEFLNQEIVGI